MRQLGTLLIALPFLASVAHAQVRAGRGTPARNAARIERLLHPWVRIADRPDTAFDLLERMRYWHVPGASIVVVDGFKIVYAKGFGVTEFGGTTPVDTTTLFQAGSISKPVFATGALRLVEQGKLALDEDVNAKLKSWQLPESRFTAREKVTLRRLLTHTAGLTVWGFPGYNASVPVPTVTQVLDSSPPANTAPVRNDTTPGARWRYSGGGFTIAQLLATDVGGEPFPALMKRLVLAPAGMTRSTYENPLPVARHREAATGHERIDMPVPGRFHTYPEMAAAGLWTTAPELARWALALTRAYNGATNGIVSPAMAKQMLSQQIVDGGGDGWGLGVAVAGAGDSLRFWHTGRDAGFVATFSMWPKLGRGYFVLTNGVSDRFLLEVRSAFAEVYGIGGAARSVRRVVKADPASLPSLVGSYVRVQGRDTITYDVTVAGGQLAMYNRFAKRRFTLSPEAPDTFFDASTDATYVFERDSTADGKPARAIRLVGLAGNAIRALRVP